MNGLGSIYLGWRYLLRHRGKAALLIATITLSLVLPTGIMLTVQKAEEHLRSRAEATPLLLGAHGSPLELVFNALYFSKPEIFRITVAEAKAVKQENLAGYIPLYVRFQARGHRIVGTSLDYFRFRGHEISEGEMMVRLGDCVLGAKAAGALDLTPGDTLISSPEQMFDIAGVYPLKMRVAGILEPAGTADDRAVFVDLKTAWVIEGLAHGHEDVRDDDEKVLEQEGSNVALNASVREYTEITEANMDSFHFHGDEDDFPITAAIVLPRDRKAETILLGRYQGEEAGAQLIRPAGVMEELFQTVFQVRNLVVAALAAVGVAAALIAGLVFVLSNRLRAREFESLANIGGDAGSVALLVMFEAMFVILMSVLLTTAVLVLLRLMLPKLLPLLTSI